MTRADDFPNDPMGPYSVPPQSFVDAEGRRIEIRVFGDGPLGNEEAERQALEELYLEFDPADRAQGVPPTHAAQIRVWLDRTLRPTALNVIAWWEEKAVGHAMLVPDDEDAYELAIFVLQAYQGAGIGSNLITCLLGEGADQGIERVWLTVERWNRVAVELYKKVGFETTHVEGFELEMAIRLE